MFVLRVQSATKRIQRRLEGLHVGLQVEEQGALEIIQQGSRPFGIRIADAGEEACEDGMRFCGGLPSLHHRNNKVRISEPQTVEELGQHLELGRIFCFIRFHILAPNSKVDRKVNYCTRWILSSTALETCFVFL